jgi:hypothetical protein
MKENNPAQGFGDFLLVRPAGLAMFARPWLPINISSKTDVHNHQSFLLVIDLINNTIFSHPEALSLPGRELFATGWSGVPRKVADTIPDLLEVLWGQKS